MPRPNDAMSPVNGSPRAIFTCFSPGLHPNKNAKALIATKVFLYLISLLLDLEAFRLRVCLDPRKHKQKRRTSTWPGKRGRHRNQLHDAAPHKQSAQLETRKKKPQR